MGFFDFNQQDLDNAVGVIFPVKEVIEFACLDYKENALNGMLILNCKVLSGEFAGRLHTIFINNLDNAVSQKLRVQFALAFWTPEELKGQTHNPAKLINRKFSAVAGQVREHNGREYQNIGVFQDLGPYESEGLEDAAAVADASFHDADGNPKF
jgi:hypothetical protein